ncbi:glutamate-rich protein 3-like [Oscarella lobularis]|uniref:glutamate-rich protein 3-like n=1 Tax=Oscarella lobularis TaxID=121494 RepID=UPI0033142170
MAFLRDPGPLAQYNSLADEHLAHYFANPRIRNHLLHAGLITKDGYVVDEVTWREKVARTEHREHVKNLLAQTIVEKAIDIERRRMTTLKRDFEDLVKLASVQRLKDSKSRGRSHEPDDDFVALLRPRLASTEASRSHRQKRSAESLRSPPSTPDSTMTSLSSRGGPFVASPYAMVPTALSLRSSGTARTRARRNQSTPPREKLRPKTAPPALSKSEPLLFKRSQTQSLAKVTLCYLGSSLQLDRYRESDSDEVTIIQQHGGGSSLCVFRGFVKPKECFDFVSKRSRGSPYGITIYINSLLDSRFGTCCEYKHKPGSRLGGKMARFQLVRVKGAAPCYRCQVDAELGSSAPKQQPVRIRERKISRTFVIKESSPTVVVTTTGDDKKEEKHESDGDSDDIDVDAVLRRYRETSKDDSSSEDEKKSDVRPGTSLSLNIPPIPVINVQDATPLPSDAGTSSSSSESESEKQGDFAEASGYSSDEEEEEEEKEEAVPEQPPKLSSNSDNDETKKLEVEEVKYSEEEFEEEADSRKESDHDDDRTNRDSEDAKPSQDVLNIRIVADEKDDEIVESESRDDDTTAAAVAKAEERLDVDKEEANVKKKSDGPDDEESDEIAKDESEPAVEPDVTTAGENEEKKESDGVKEPDDVATGKESDENAEDESEENDAKKDEDESRPAVEPNVTTTGENEEKKMSDAKKDEEKDEDESRPAIERDVATAVEREEKSEDAESRSVKKDSDKETIEKESDGEKESDEIESRSATATIDSLEEKRTKAIDSNEEENIQEKSPEDRQESDADRRDAATVPEIQIRRTQSQDLLENDEARDEFAASPSSPTKPPFETMASAKNLLRQTTSGLSIRLSDDDEGKINDDDILSSVTSSSVSLLDSSKIPSLTNSLSDVAMKSRNSRSSLKEMHRVGRTPQTSSGELSEPVAPLVKGKEDVELANVALTEKQVKEVAAVLEEEEAVNTVSFRNASVTDKGAAAVAEAIMTNETSVKMLNFNLNNLGAKGAKHVAKTLRRKSLEFLLLHGNKIGDEGLRHIVDSLVGGGDETTSTMIPRPPPGNPPENRRRLRRRQRRRSSSSSSSSTSSTSSLSSIASTVLAPNATLTCLDVGDCGLTASAAFHVARLLAGNSSLKELNLSANRLGVDAWRQIGDGLGKNSSLTSLCLDYCDLGDDGLVALCDAFAHTTSLKSVDLEGNGITDRGARVLLEALKLNSTLVELTLAPGNSISSELMSELAVALKSRQE